MRRSEVRGASLNEVMLPFANSIFGKASGLRNLEAVLSSYQRSQIEQGISDDIKRCGTFTTPWASESALSTARELPKPVNLWQETWHSQPRFDLNRKIFHIEHYVPVAILRDECIGCKSPDEVLVLLTNRLRIVWILKTEDQKLTDCGHQRKRPDPAEAYEKAGIKVLKQPANDGGGPMQT